MKNILLIPLLLTSIGCVTESRSLAHRSISTITIGPTIDGKSKLIRTRDIETVSQGLDPILAAHGFALRYRTPEYAIVPATGTALTSDYWLRPDQPPGWTRCLIRIDSHSISILLEVGESHHGARDFPSLATSHELADSITPEITKYLEEVCPGRAIEIAKTYWKE